MSILKAMTLLTLTLLITACGGLRPGVPGGAVAWCGQFDYTGTFTKSQTNGRALGLSDSGLAASMSVEDVIALAESMGCSN